MLQSTFFDPVLGLDTHVVGIPAPPAPLPVPTPIPMPFVGMVFDPLGLMIGAAIGMATGGGPGIVLVNFMPVTNCGTDVTNKLTMPHIPAPGVMFIPPPMPSNDALLMFGSLNVTLAGSLGVRLGDIALSCNDPVRLPTSIVMAIPKGPMVLNMPPMVPDFKAIAMAAAMKMLGALARKGAALFRKSRFGSAFLSRMSKKLGGCFAPDGAGRLRQMWARAVRTVTGHPVDVVTGNLFTDCVDVSLPGPLPLVIERVYESAGSDRSGTLGHGWNHSLDESLWMERGRAVVRCGDGREVEFPLWDLPDRTMRPGDVLERVIHKMKLKFVGRDRFAVEHGDGRVHEFAPVPGGDPRIARLVRIRSRDGHHAIDLTYDPAGRLEWVRDSAGRNLRFHHDRHGRLVSLALPSPDGSGSGLYVHRQYIYDDQGDLVEVMDSAGRSWRYAYQTHLLVQETDRTGFSFYFLYDGVGSNAKCVRTWGDGGVYDHVIAYDQPNKKTIVEDSLGAVTAYVYNERNQVVTITNALGQTTTFDYDPDTGGRTLEQDPAGAKLQRSFDKAGNLVEVIAPNGATTRIESEGSLPVRAVDPRGGEWRWGYDREGHVVERKLPTGQRILFGWERGLLAWRRDAPGRQTSFEYDDRKNLTAMTFPNGGVERYVSDNLGRAVEIKNADDGVERIQYDLEGNVVETHSPTSTVYRFRHDAEGNLTEAEDERRIMRLGHARRRIVWREDAGARTSFQWDTEGRLVAVVNERGERFSIEVDEVGRARQEIGFDGRKRSYERDAAGRVIKEVLPGGTLRENAYDPVGRLVETKHPDGTFARFAFDPGGLVVAAENESGRVEIDYDAGGRVTAERTNGREVRSTYGLGGERTEMVTSLGARVAIGRDALGGPQELFLRRASAAGRPTNPDVRFERDPLGLERVRRHGNGIDIQWDWDVAGRPTSRRTLQRLAAGRASPDASPEGWSGAREVDARSYKWRGEDQISAIIDPVYGPRLFDHDNRGRLIRERRPDRTIERMSDATGNVYRTADGRDRVYGRDDRLEVADGVRYVHDGDGNQTLKIQPDGATWKYTWNGHGALREVERPDGVRVQFDYDAFARRTAKRTIGTDGMVRTETDFVWDGHVVIHELDSDSGLVTWHWEPERFVPLAKEVDGRRWVIASDHLGTPTEMYDEHGTLAWKMQLDVFGVATFPIGSARDCPWRWPGQYEDEEVEGGFYYNRTRYYAADRGSFLSRDPAGLAAGLNLYRYVGDPLTWIDLLGLTGTYIFEFPSGERYIGKGPIDRALTSQSQRAAQVGSTPSAVTHGAHVDFGSDRMGLMVEAELMRRNNFGSNPNLLNAINSPGESLLQNATAAERRVVTRNANAVERAFLQSTGRIC